MSLRFVLYSPDRGTMYDGRTPDQVGVGGGITARLSLLGALADLGCEVTAYVNCRERVRHAGVSYIPLDEARRIETDVFIAMSTGGALSFAPLRDVDVRARLKLVWVQGVPKPADLDVVGADRFVTASRFLREVLVARWGVPFERIFPCYNGLHQERFADAEARAVARDPHALAYIGPPEKGLASAIEVLRRLRTIDDRFHLDVFGGGQLWGRPDDETPAEPGVRAMGLVGQADLVPKLFEYEYCLAPQAMEEGFGIAVQEAKRAGQVVLASRVGAFGELIRDGHDGFLIDEPHTTAASHDRMAEIVAALANDPAQRARIRRRAMAAASALSWSQAARTWVEYVRGAAPHILIAGYYGHGNLGDEAILQAMLGELRDQMPSLQVTVASGNPGETRVVHHVDAIDERDVPALIEAAARSRAVVLGGGGLFHDYFGLDDRTLLSTQHWGLTFLAAFPAIASSQQVPFVLAGVGVGPLNSPEGRRYTRLIFERASLATVRDVESRNLLASIGVAVDRVDVAADPAFLVERPPVSHASALLEEAGVPRTSSRVVSVVLRAWNHGVDPNLWQRAVADALDRLVDASGASVLFIPFQSTSEDSLTDDRVIAATVRDLMRRREATAIASPALELAEVQQLFAVSSVVLTMRRHGVVFAAGVGVPVVALSYDPKVRMAMRQIGREDAVIDLATLCAGSKDPASEVLRALQTGLAEAGSSDPARLDALRAAARRSLTDLVTFLRADDRPIPVPSPEWAPLIEAALVDRARDAAVMAARADDLASRAVAEQQAAARAIADAAEARTQAAEAHGQAAEAHARVAEVRAQVADAQALAAETSRALAVREQEFGWLAAEVADLRAVVNRRPVRAYLRLRAAARRMPRRLLMTPAKAVVRAAARHLMTGPSYVFDQFKRARMTTYGAHLTGLHAPGEPGLVSIVLPVFNGEALVRSAIESVLRQTYKRFELIVIDDGSTDDTPRIADEAAAADPRVRVVHQENRRLPASLSRGFRLARGEFLTWTSADNRLKPTCLEKLVACLQRHPSWDVAYANLDVIGEDGNVWRGSPHYEGYQRPHGSEHVFLPKSTGELNVVANNSVGAAFLYRSRVASLIGDYSRHRFIMEDYDYWMRANALMTVRHADFREPIYDYRFHSQSLTSRWEEFDMLGNRDRMMVFDDFRRDFSLSPMVWVIDGPAAPLGAALQAAVRGAGHFVHAGEYALASLPSWSVPIVCARVTSDPASEPACRSDVPAAALKVLITDAAALPNRVGDSWDVCISLNGTDRPPRLSKEFQGWLSAPDLKTLVHAIDVRAKSDHLQQIEEVLEGKGSVSPEFKASVIICTRRWSDRLERALAAVAAQVTSHSYEVIVVDNGGQDRVRNAAVGGRVFRPGVHGDVRFVFCPVPGLSAARNAGLAEARGEIVCFLDDDALAEPDWLEWICRAFDEHPNTAVVGGHIRLKMPAKRPRALRQGWTKYWSEFLTGYTEYTEVAEWGRYPWGANWSARRDLLRAVGGFRSRYGRKGNDYWGGEEMVAASLVQRLGGRIAVEPRATVIHDVDPSRFTLSHVLRTMIAGYQVYHRAQSDLYVPRQDRLVAVLRRLRAKDFDREVGYGRLRWVDAALRRYAQASLLLTEMADLGRRARRPVVDQ